MKYAKATIVDPHVTGSGWAKIRTAAKASAGVKENLVARASEFFGKPFDPKDYLLTHCTIVASVDVYSPPEMKLGKVLVNGFRVYRKYPNFRVKVGCDKYINNNLDFWPREVLLKSYKTFIGGHNFVEHVQVEDLSKGRIIDAVARDLGDTVYVDILIATDRKHTDLVAAIESGKMGTLSMGCFLPGTLVTMADGTRIPIEDVAPGDMVLTHKGRSREVVNKQIRGGTWDMRTVHAVGLASPIVSTSNHPYYVLRPADVCACGCGEDLPVYKPQSSGTHTTRALKRRFKVGHDKNILNPNNTYSIDEFKLRQAQMDEIKSPGLVKVRAEDLRVGDFIAFPRVKDSEATVETTEGKARLLGYFLAEGSFLKHRGKHCEVQFNFSMDEKDTFVAEVARLLEQEFPEAGTPWVQDRPDRSVCAVHVTGKDLVGWFLQHGGEYSHGKQLSADAMNWSMENHKHLIGAWLNGDGHRAKAGGGFLVGTSVSLALACQMHTLMAKCGWFARFEARIGAKSVTVAEAVNGGVAIRDDVTGRLPAYLLTIGNTQSVDLVGYCAKAPLTSHYANQNNRVLDDWVVSPITAIEESTFDGWVHDMEVDEDHTYIVEGASVSNCTVTGTQCTKCGHWAADETEMCNCIKYEKGNTFFDEQGRSHRIAEKCGDEAEPDGGVQFIEASWVGTPAFTGAVLRNIVDVSPDSDIARSAAAILSQPPEEWSKATYRKAATLATTFMAGWGDDEGGEDVPAEESAAPATPKGPFEDLEDELTTHLKDRVRQKLKKEMDQKDIEEALSPAAESSTNDTIGKEGQRLMMDDLVEDTKQRFAYGSTLSFLCRTASNDADLLNKVAELNAEYGVSIPVPVYRAALRLGSLKGYTDLPQFTRACQSVLGKTPTIAEVQTLIRLGKIISRRGQARRGDQNHTLVVATAKEKMR